MDKRIIRYTSLEEMKAADKRAWQRLPPGERIRAVMEITTSVYAMKGHVLDVPRLQKTLVRIQRPSR
ncbi:hypothetical protein ACG33_14360 [Steroidobacter denitrificans]|uniref:Uncharacterized protein n=1 Tax=Steroidobacter denitrificans TaxID=465721 RepID=A0A127FED7_STEDE|nr:hypothetical protein [Steroidobacter denitrificans]AMN48259.1 hypothetical protein ACG33_14360 [Steroidobacter denitrificans]